jgi:peptide/histidine transporter 3/4
MYILIAVAECLINVTAYELFYNEVPIYLKSTCQAINLFMVAMGSNLTSTFTLIFQNYIGSNSLNYKHSTIPYKDSLNHGHFEYMYYTLGALSIVNIVGYVIVMQWMEFGMNKEDDEGSFYDDVNLIDSQGNDITQRQRHSSFESISLSRAG